jgi:hypothetical protein
LLHGPEIDIVISICSTRYTNTVTTAQTGGGRTLEWFWRLFLLVYYLTYFYTLKMERTLTSESSGSLSLSELQYVITRKSTRFRLIRHFNIL